MNLKLRTAAAILTRIDSQWAERAKLIIAALLGITLGVASGLAADAKQKKVKRADILEAEQLLENLGYWTGPVDGKFDGGSRHALIAFQKVEGQKPTGRLTSESIASMRDARRLKPKETGYAHVEVDLMRQVMFVVEVDGEVSRILPVSSGNGELFTSEGWTRRAVTPTGRFTVLRKINGWRKSPLGSLYYPLYIVGGVAIHGNPLVPTYPASHGCIRIPMFAAKEFSRITPTGTVVLVYDDPRPEAERDVPAQAR